MPKIDSRIMEFEQLKKYSPVLPNKQADHNMDVSSSLMMTSTSTNLMSINQGNSVPMRGIMPIEQMSDCDIYRFFPNSAYMDRIWSYTYSALANRS